METTRGFGTKVVYKYPLPTPDENGIVALPLPKSAHIMSVAVEPDDSMVAYAIVDADDRSKVVGGELLRVVNTGQKFEGTYLAAYFLATLRTSNGIVWHVFRNNGQ